MNKKRSSKSNKILDTILSLVCLLAAIFHIFIAWNTSISIIQQRVFHVFVMILIFFLMKCSASAKTEKKYSATIYGLCSLLAVVSGSYFLLRTNLDVMLKRSIQGTSDVEILFGVLLIIGVMYLAWRTVGWALSALSAIFLLYAIAGPYMPDIISH